MSDSDLYSRSSVGSSIAISGAWLARMPIEPTPVRVDTISTSSSKTLPSGVRTSTGNLFRAIILGLGGLLGLRLGLGLLLGLGLGLGLLLLGLRLLLGRLAPA